MEQITCGVCIPEGETAEEKLLDLITRTMNARDANLCPAPVYCLALNKILMWNLTMDDSIFIEEGE